MFLSGKGVAELSVPGTEVIVMRRPKPPEMVYSSAFTERRISSSRDASRSSLWRSTSKAGQRSHKWSYDSSSFMHGRQVDPSDRLIRLFQRRGAGGRSLWTWTSRHPLDEVNRGYIYGSVKRSGA